MTADLAAAIKSLNRALVADPEAIAALIGNRVECNQDLAVHPFVQVLQGADKKYRVGILGIINGIMEPMTKHRIAVMIDKDSGKIKGFEVRPVN